MGDYDGSPDMNEKNMMKEIRARGPITVGIIMPVYATYYKSGILTCKDVLLPDDRFTETQEEILRRIRDDFRLVEHLVAAVGWGETETGEKYWILQNSYRVF